MPRYGIIESGKLCTSEKQLAGYKPIVYAEIPEFDQMTQAIYQGEVMDEGEYISISVEVRNVEQDDENGEEFI